MKLTAKELVQELLKLTVDKEYNYISGKNKVKIKRIIEPEGPIHIERNSEKATISSEMIRRYSNAFQPNVPINVDRVFGASYNTRSALETLVAYTPNFYHCKPKRVSISESTTVLVKGHKHLMWCPENPHVVEELKKVETELTISETPSQVNIYEVLISNGKKDKEIDNIDVIRRHAQIQIALYEIGKVLSSKIWVAKNDWSIQYKEKPLKEHDEICQNLSKLPLLSSFPKAVQYGELIDCMWIKNDREIPVVFEIEHSTGVTSGLTRMNEFKKNIPPIPVRWVVVAPDEIRDKVVKETNREQFKEMNCSFLSYSSVEELYSLCQRRKLKKVVDEKFIDAYLEKL